MAGLRLQLDPSGMVAGERQAENALDRLKGKAVTTGRELDVLGAKGQRAGVVLAGGATQAASGMQRFSAAARPVSMQLSQVAQQTMATGNAVQALAIQLPDIGLAFGTVGTAAGVVAGIALPILMQALGDTGAQADALRDNIDDLSSSVSDWAKYADLARTPLSNLSEEFGLGALRADRMYEALSNLARLDALDALDAATETLRGTFSSLDKVMFGAKTSSFLFGQSVENTSLEIREKFGISYDAAVELRDALADLENAKGPESVANATARLNELLMSTRDESGNIPPQLRDAARAAAEAAVEASRLASPISAATSEADGLNSSLQGVLGTISGILSSLGSIGFDTIGIQAETAAIKAGKSAAAASSAGRIAQKEAELRNIGTPDWAVNTAMVAMRDAEGKRVEALDARAAAQKSASKSGRSGGKGKGAAGEAEKAATAYRSLIGSLDPLTAAANAYADAQETINAALKAGKIDATEAARANELAQERFDSATLAAQKGVNVWAAFQDAGGAALDRLIDGTMSLKDALKDMIKEIVLAITKKRLLASIDGGSASDSVGTLLMKGLTGGFAGLFDAGGVINNGQTGIVGENGPELVRSTAGGAVVTSRGETSRRLGNGGASNTFHIDARGAQKGVGEEIAAAMRAYAPAIVGQAVGQVRTNLKGWNDQIQSDGALA